MKKFIIFSLIAVMVTGTVFAADGIFFNAWGRGAFAPLISVSDEKNDKDTVKDSARTYVGTGTTWGGWANRPRVDFRLNGATDFVGFMIASNGEMSNGLGQQDNGAHIWAKPFENDILKITVGRFVDDTLRGKVGSVNNGFECLTLVGYANHEEDPIFTRFNTWGADGARSGARSSHDAGFMLSSAPVDGLFIGALLNASGIHEPWSNNDAGQTLAADAYRHIQVGLGYEIADTAHIRAQFLGGYLGTFTQKKLDDMAKKGDSWFPTGADPARVEVAFALTAVQNLLIDLGAKIWLPITDDVSKKKYSNGLDVSLGVNFRAAAFSLAFRADAESLGAYTGGRPTSGGNDKATDAMLIDVRLVPAYDINTVCIGLDLGMIMTGESKGVDGKGQKDKTSVMGFGLFAKKGLPGGYAKAGLTYRLAPSYDGKTAGSSVFMIPVVLEYAFF